MNTDYDSGQAKVDVPFTTMLECCEAKVAVPFTDYPAFQQCSDGLNFYCSCYNVVREKHCSGWKNKPNKPEFSPGGERAGMLDIQKRNPGSEMEPAAKGKVTENTNDKE